MIKTDVVIIGGGASGVLCALLLKEANINVTLIESQDRILKKLLVTGNGRCNITNRSMKKKEINESITKYFSSSSKKELTPLFYNDFNKIQNVFLNLGIPYVELEEGKIYPRSLQASSVVDALRFRLNELNIPLLLSRKINSVKSLNSSWQINTDKEIIECNKLIISTGGLAMPSSGSDGSFMKVIRNLKLDIVKQEPALVQLKTDFPNLRSVSGVKNESKIYLIKDDKVIHEEKGELLFTDYGVSGPPILQISRFCAINSYENLRLKIDLFPEISTEVLLKDLKHLINLFPKRSAMDIFLGIINKKLIPVLLKQVGLQKMNVEGNEIPKEVIERFAFILKNLEMKITGHNGYGNAQSTVGGISLEEINLSTMEAYKYKNLYFTGEILDVCGACGGYNLTWAWATALTCSEAIIKK